MTNFFFDLDGTLTDSHRGIVAAFRAGMVAVGAPDLPDSALRAFLGTPLPQFFDAVSPGLTPAAIEAGIAAFRRYYKAEGIFENVLYSGAAVMLERLHRQGDAAWIVTSKPQPQAEQVADLLGISRYLDGIVGASLAETDTKTDLVARALARAGAQASATIMLGDRHYDVTGALENGVQPVGALWGYGDLEELRAAGCHAFAVSIEDFVARFVVPRTLVDAAD